MKADFKLNKSICDTKFIVYFRGHNGHQGHKRQKLSVFFPQEHARRSRGEFVRENALTPVVIGGCLPPQLKSTFSRHSPD